MKLPRNLSGTQLAKSLCKHWDYVLVHQTGSHMILDTAVPHPQRIAIPAHHVLKPGTLNAILRAVSAHKSVSRENILGRL